ncbi:hypothetical protein MVEN_01258400 [Mycena venus]|uniref:C3H1-type domain-containing protein n=1 Tax=Mycena venus TaxID=2733690 RepID=A0A8H6Y6R7_9AGAR|nr:hypothetical protein MVEN_01258400 [Mycena venus]
MEVAPPNPSHISQEFQHRIELSFDQLKNEVFSFLGYERASQEKCLRLEKELNVYKLALGGLEARCSGLEAECSRLRTLHHETVKENECLQDLMKGHRIITLIDGDGAIFSKDLISQGQQGGHLAARMLSDSIIKFLSTNHGARPYQLWVYLFYNRRGLTDTFNRVGLGSLNKTFEEFVVGFNQATERFTMVDVGNTKEAADVKLKVHLQDDIQLPQTFKIVFGGCHDGGYVASLHSQITAGFREKLILLKGYSQMASTIAELGLPFLEIPDLFMTQKLAPVNRWTTPLHSPNQMVTDTETILDDSSKMSTAESDEVESAGTSYSRILQRATLNLCESTRDRSPSTEASRESSYAHATPGTRHVNPAVRLSKQKPPPCTLFYLSTCKHGSKCKYAHDYLLTEEHFQEMRENARKGPCPMINRDEDCTWGDACVYGHYCPSSTKCPFYKIGTCKFQGVSLPAPLFNPSPFPPMATQPMGETGQQLWDDTLGRLINLSNATIKRNAFLEAHVAELELEVAMWQRAHNVALEASERDGKAHQRLVCSLNKQISKRDLFENQNPLILCVINGDEKVFNGFGQGHDGGVLAAQDLTQQIATYLTADELHIFGRISFWITVFYNRCELLDRLIGNNICSVQQFDAFVAGFSQCSPRFSLIDVGCTNNTDTKIREYISTHTRFPQTLRVFLAGGHGPQYASTFDGLESEQLLGKLVIVGLNDGEGSSMSLPLPSLNVTDGLFMHRKLQPKSAPLSGRCVNTNGGLISPQSPASHIGSVNTRTIDPSLPLHKQNPPPCNEHYLMTCSKGPAICKYSHEYILTQDQLASLANNAKKAPCNWLKNGLQCPYGDKCCWGHACPNGINCFHLSKGKCWFKGEAMHPPLPPDRSPT